MNEIDSFCNRECASISGPSGEKSEEIRRLRFYPINPPYTIHNMGNHTVLNVRILDMTAQHYNGALYTIYMVFTYKLTSSSLYSLPLSHLIYSGILPPPHSHTLALSTCFLLSSSLLSLGHTEAIATNDALMATTGLRVLSSAAPHSQALGHTPTAGQVHSLRHL